MLKKPRVDDQPILQILYGLAGAQALFVAHDLKLFSLLAKGPLTLAEICAEYRFHPRAGQALLSMLTSQHLLCPLAGERYGLTEISEDYLLETSPTYFGGVLDRCWQLSGVYSFESFKKALFTNKSQIYGGADLFEANERKEELAKGFTRSMHGKSMGPASAWPAKIDLSGSRCLLDVGGGSGAHAIGAVLAWPGLRAIIYDRPLVCEVADDFVREFNLQDRIQTRVGDMWKDEFPKADIHFYSDIFHDWTPEQCAFLAEKSFAALEPGGKIILHEMLFDEQKTGPYSVAAYNIFMLLWAKGQQFSSRELHALLHKAGFVEIQCQPTGFGSWSLITGQKPKTAD